MHEQTGILLLFLGWLLGILSHRLVTYIERQARRPEIRRSVLAELDELRFKMNGVAFLVRDRNGTLDREFLSLWSPRVMRYRGLHEFRKVADLYKELESLSAEKLLALNAAALVKHRGLRLGVKKHTVPFLTSQMDALPLFGLTFQRIAMEILTKLDSLNSEVEILWKSADRSFSIEDEANHQTNEENMDRSLITMEGLATQIAPRIDELENCEWKRRWFG
jgi:hypothetical protein